METASHDVDGFVFGKINQTVLLIDPSGPESCQIISERLRFSGAGERMALAFFQEVINLFEDLHVLFLPIKIILPGVIGPRQGKPFSLLLIAGLLLVHCESVPWSEPGQP